MAAAEGTFYRTLLRGKKEGELKGVRDPRAVARSLNSSLQGLALMAKATHDRKTLEDVVKVTLSVLKTKFFEPFWNDCSRTRLTPRRTRDPTPPQVNIRA